MKKNLEILSKEQFFLLKTLIFSLKHSLPSCALIKVEKFVMIFMTRISEKTSSVIISYIRPAKEM